MPTIRNATTTDIPLLAGLVRKANQDVAKKFNLTPGNCPTHPSYCTPDWIETAMAKGIQYFVLEEEDTSRGCMALEQASPDICYLERLAVLPQYQYQGYGRALVQHGFTEAAKRGVTRVEIAIIAQHIQLKNWYEKLGFTVIRTKTFDHLPFDVTFMGINLSAWVIFLR